MDKLTILKSFTRTVHITKGSLVTLCCVPRVSELNVSRDYVAAYTVFVCKCFLLFSVTEDHPEVQTMVLTALEEAKHQSTSPFSLYAGVLEKRIKEVCYKIWNMADVFTLQAFWFLKKMSIPSTFLLWLLLEMYWMYLEKKYI